MRSACLSEVGKELSCLHSAPLEAVLHFTKRDYTDAEARFLDAGAQYLIEHRLICSKTEGRTINEEWLKPFFPRYFEYDILRGLSYLVDWSSRREKPLPVEIIEEGLNRLESYITDSGIVIERRVNDKNGDWRGRAFPLMKAVSEVGRTSPCLTRQIDAVFGALRSARRRQ